MNPGPNRRRQGPGPRAEAARLVRDLRLRLEDAHRAGLAAVPRRRAHPGPPAAPVLPGAEPPGDAAPPRDEAPAGPVQPERRTADAFKEALHVAAAQQQFQAGFDFGSPDLEGGTSREEALARVAAEVAACQRCPELAENRNLTVPGQGDANAGLVFIGEGPGEEEDRQGLAFVGRAGGLLTKMIEAIDLSRDEVFIGNIIKCRPPGNRNPSPVEAANCRPYLMRQLEILRPRVIVALGGVAAQNLLQTHDGIGRLRGRFYPLLGAKVMPTYHPAYLLRSYTPENRRKVYEDLKQARAELDRAT